MNTEASIVEKRSPGVLARRKGLDISGRRFGRLIAVAETPKQLGGTRWECRCDCGNIKITRVHSLTSGRTRSCGCLQVESGKALAVMRLAKQGLKLHGMWNTRTHRIWNCIKTRCTNPNRKHWGSYGGRGIKVCERWFLFENFLQDMGICPPNRSIDRIDNNGNYEPGNCRWATLVEQAANKRPRTDAIKITYLERSLTVRDWAKETGLPISTIRIRLKYGWTLDRIFTTPRRENFPRRLRERAI